MKEEDLLKALGVRHTYLDLFVAGVPVPQGSKTAGRTSSGGFYMREANKNLKPWRNKVQSNCSVVWGEREPMSEALQLNVVFYMPRPKAHYMRGDVTGSIKENAPLFHSVRPDRDKLLRAIQDALEKAGVVKDDSRFASGTTTKRYIDAESPCPGVWIVLRNLKD